jgi:hypothetical protein
MKSRLIKQALLHKQEIIVIFQDNKEIYIPLVWFTPSGDGTTPDLHNISIIDGGQTLCLGKYEVSCDAILEEWTKNGQLPIS